MTTVAEQYPARTDSNGNTWYRPADGIGWTSDITQADPSYRPAECPCLCHEGMGDIEHTGQKCPCRTTYHYVITDDPTTEEDTSMTAIADDGEIAPPTTEWQGYPLPPVQVRGFIPRYNGYKQYVLPSPSTGREIGYSRATTVAETLPDSFGLTVWKRREAVKAVVRVMLDAKADPSSQAALRMDQLVNAIETSEKVGDIDKIIDLIWNENGGLDAAELGGAVHDWLGALDLGLIRFADLPDQMKPYAEAYYGVLRRFGLVAVPVYVERVVLNDRGEETIVGTLDRIYRVVATGELILGDLKTSKSLEYSWLGFSVQLAVYGYATKMLSVDGKVWEDMPEINTDFALVIHVPSNQPEKAEAVTIDLWAGGEALIASMAARQMRRDAKKAIPFKHAIPSPTPASIRYAEAWQALMDISAADDLNGVWEQYQDVWDDALTEFGSKIAESL